MDQSTQVNFPTLTKYPRKRLQRYNTSGDLRLPNKGLHPSSSWLQMKPTTLRPKYLNFSTETLQKSKFTYNADSPMHLNRLSFPPSEATFASISRERTPPFSSSSSLVGVPNHKSYQPPIKQIQFSSHSGNQRFSSQTQPTKDAGGATTCKCFYEPDPKDKSKIPATTPEGLSWRRLHMSRAKLKATSTTSELLSGFAMVAMVELQINDDTTVPEWLFVMFSICTTVLVAVHIFALMISTYILPNIDAISKLDVCELVAESPHERMKGFIELAWAFSTVLGLFLFLVELAILCWVKFWDYSFAAAIAATVIVIPVLVIFVLFAVHFYHSLVVHKCQTSISDMQKLEDMKKQLDEVTSLV